MKIRRARMACVLTLSFFVACVDAPNPEGGNRVELISTVGFRRGTGGLIADGRAIYQNDSGDTVVYDINAQGESSELARLLFEEAGPPGGSNVGLFRGRYLVIPMGVRDDQEASTTEVARFVDLSKLDAVSVVAAIDGGTEILRVDFVATSPSYVGVIFTDGRVVIYNIGDTPDEHYSYVDFRPQELVQGIGSPHRFHIAEQVEGLLIWLVTGNDLLAIDVTRGVAVLRSHLVLNRNGRSAPESRASSIAVADSTAYILTGDAFLRAYHIGDPRAPTLMYEKESVIKGRDLSVSGDLMLVACNSAGVYLFSIKSPGRPVLQNRLFLGNAVQRVFLDGYLGISPIGDPGAAIVRIF